MLVGISCELLYHLAWRPIPKPVLGQVLAGCRIADTADLVGFEQRDASAPPFITKPALNAHRTFGSQDLHAPLVEHTDLGHDREAPDGLAVDVASDVSDPLIPRDRLD